MAASSNGAVRLGEIIETSTVRIWVESDHLHVLPPLGSLVRVSMPDGSPIFAVVSFGQTGGIDASRRAIRRGSAELRDDEIYRRHPELAQILRTTFEVLPIAFRSGGTMYRNLPPLPPPLHYSVEEPSPSDLRAVTDRPTYLPIIASTQGEVPPEQLIIAHLRWVYEARGADAAWLDAAAQEVARLFKDDYDRLLPVLEAVDPDVQRDRAG